MTPGGKAGLRHLRTREPDGLGPTPGTTTYRCVTPGSSHSVPRPWCPRPLGNNHSFCGGLAMALNSSISPISPLLKSGTGL